MDVPSCVAKLSFLVLSETSVGILFQFPFGRRLGFLLRQRVQDLSADPGGVLFISINENDDA